MLCKVHSSWEAVNDVWRSRILNCSKNRWILNIGSMLHFHNFWKTTFGGRYFVFGSKYSRLCVSFTTVISPGPSGNIWARACQVDTRNTFQSKIFSYQSAETTDVLHIANKLSQIKFNNKINTLSMCDVDNELDETDFCNFVKVCDTKLFSEFHKFQFSELLSPTCIGGNLF